MKSDIAVMHPTDFVHVYNSDQLLGECLFLEFPIVAIASNFRPVT